MTTSDICDFKGNERFSIVRRLGAGGMGVVYEAQDAERNQRVALKTLREMDATALYRFKHEFRSLAEIVHPNLCPLYELISDGDQWFFTMELIDDGIDFLTYIRGDRPTLKPDLLSTSDSGDVTTPRPSRAPAQLSSTTTAGFEAADQTGDTSDQSGSPDLLINTSDLGSSTTVSPEQATRPPVDRADQEKRLPDSPDQNLMPSAARRRVENIDFERIRAAFRQLAEGVWALHSAAKLHRDLKSANAMVRRDGRVVLLDFGLVAELSHASKTEFSRFYQHSEAPKHLAHYSTDHRIAGTGAFMSPEQAAGQPLTPASDWYSVGVMLYQAITGELPFTGSPSDVLRAKQVKDAPAPAHLFSGIPEDLNALCVDLLKRNPEARPGGPEVLERLSARPDAAGARDVTSRAESVPFVGREAHLAELARAFNDMLDGKAVLYFVCGKSGAGKSALIQHFLDGLAERPDVVVLAGRCYEQESVPYKAVDSLIDALTRYLLRVPESAVAKLIPRDIAALARIFPVLNRLASVAAASAGEVESSDLRELRRRAFVALRELLSRISRQHKLVVYIDDLQWGDADSAALLADLFRPPDSPRLVLLMAYRSEYEQTSACLRTMLAAQVETGSSQVRGTLVVDALTRQETHNLAVTLLGRDRVGAQAEAEWVVRESGGSALFIYELVRHLKAGMSLASAEGVDLDEVLWSRVMRLPATTRRLLEVVAVAGKPVALRSVQQAAGLASLPPHEVAALRNGHLVRTTGPHLDDAIESYHDRVRESVVEHLSAETRRAHHTGLAEALQTASGVDPETLATHFEGAQQLAKASQYYAAAAAQAAKVLAFDRSEELYKKAAALAQSDFDRASVYEKMIHFYTDIARFADAYEIGRRGTELFGEKLPAKFIPPLFLFDFVKSKIRLKGRKARELLYLPTMTDARLETVVRLINAVAKAAYQVRPELCVAVSTKSVNLCLKHGNTGDCAVGYMVYGAIFQGGVRGNHPVGYDFGRLVLDLVEKYANAAQRSEVNFVVGHFGTSWMRPVIEAESLFYIAHNAGLETRDLFHTGCSCAGIIMSYHMRGVPMDRVWSESDRLLEFLGRCSLREPIAVISAVRQFMRNLRGETRDRHSFSDGEFNEPEYVRQLATFGSRHFAQFYYVVKTQSLYLWGEYEKALETVNASASFLKESPGMLHSAEHHFFHALVLAALYPTRGRFQRWSYFSTLRRTHRMLCKWAAQCPHNFLHKERLVAAEICRVRGQAGDAARVYDEAIAAAARFGYLQVEALANGRAAQLHRISGNKTGASRYLNAARECYRRWGADAYAAWLQA